LRTQLHSPSIDTRYQRPATSAIPSGTRIVLPVRRPGTSSVTQRRGNKPSAKARPQNLAYHFAVSLPRPPTYISRAARSLTGQRPTPPPPVYQQITQTGRRDYGWSHTIVVAAQTSRSIPLYQTRLVALFGVVIGFRVVWDVVHDLAEILSNRSRQRRPK